MTGDDLLLELALRPDDEALRQVFVDWLLEHEPERGLHAQLVRAGDEAAAAVLFARHEAAWVSEALRRHAAPGSVRLRDGLLDAVRLNPMTEAEAVELAMDPCWKFARRLEHAPLPVLREATAVTSMLLDEASTAALMGWKVALPRVTTLALELGSIERAGPLVTPAVFPALTALELHPQRGDAWNPRAVRVEEDEFSYGDDFGEPAQPPTSAFFEPPGWEAFFAAALPKALSTVEVCAGFVDVAEWSRFLESTRCAVERFVLSAVHVGGARWRIGLLRTAPGRYRRLEVLDWGISADDAADVVTVLETSDLEVVQRRRPRR